MKKSELTLPLTLTALVTLLLLAAVFLRAFRPELILPRLDIPTVVLLCLIALVAEHYLSPGAVHHYGFLALLGAVIFGLLPFAASFAAWQRSLLLGGVGAAVLAGLAALLTSLCRRIDTGPKAPLAPVACALCLYLASQAFRGVLL